MKVMHIVIGSHAFFIIATVVVAGFKNRSLVGWFFASLFLSWIALLIVAFLPGKYTCRR